MENRKTHRYAVHAEKRQNIRNKTVNLGSID